ncbi:MAG: PAS domain-containing sensor histidine kinase [Thaumarchaeota archaeon]|nr:MAG: PAS domain-containing sensor histidine kinase [Nitrososphaerota archaeon]
MDSFGSVGGLLIGVLGLAVAAIGLDPTNHYASQIFSLGVAGIVAGGLLVWLGSRKPAKTILTQQYETKSAKSDSVHEAVKYKNLYEGSPVLQRTVNTDGLIIECNQAYVKTFGHTKEEIIGKSLFEHTADQSMEDMRKTFETWKQTGKVSNVEVWFKRKDDSTFPGLISANNIYDDKGRLIGSNTVIRDVSEVYQARKVLDLHERQKIQLEELKKMDAVKEEFYMMVAKECQIPIEPIKRYCEILKDSSGKLNAKQQEAIDEIHYNAARLEQLIHDIVDVQKLNSNRMEFKKEEFNLDEFMNSMVDTCSPMMTEKKIEFVNMTSYKSNITTDKARLKQVFYNLVQNAVDFVPQQNGKIEIGASTKGDSILFYVKDNGIGISEKRKESIFKKFYQVELSFKRKYGGTGFGLVICKGIVENLGGKIWFESKEGEGTTFYFTIPK